VLRSVARKRILETENPSVCATVNWKLCKSAMVLYLSAIKRTCNQVLINPIVRTRSRYFHHAYHSTCDNILLTDCTSVIRASLGIICWKQNIPSLLCSGNSRPHPLSVSCMEVSVLVFLCVPNAYCVIILCQIATLKEELECDTTVWQQSEATIKFLEDQLRESNNKVHTETCI
jgi:hypothetical protein